jgi:hypothetical protein
MPVNGNSLPKTDISKKQFTELQVNVTANHQLKIPILSADPNELTPLPSGSNKDHTYSPNRYNQVLNNVLF